MGKWTYTLSEDVQNLDGRTFGHTVKVYVKLRYEPSLFGKFEEPGLLDWHERFILKNHKEGT